MTIRRVNLLCSISKWTLMDTDKSVTIDRVYSRCDYKGRDYRESSLYIILTFSKVIRHGCDSGLIHHGYFFSLGNGSTHSRKPPILGWNYRGRAFPYAIMLAENLQSFKEMIHNILFYVPVM